MKVHSVIAVNDEQIKTRGTTCACQDCYQENGFYENTKCSWTKHCLTKVQKRVRNTESDTSNAQVNQPEMVGEMNNNVHEDKNPSNKNDVPVCMNEKDFVVLVYEKKNYIGQIMNCDDEDNEVEVKCMEKCGKVDGRFKWPRTEDITWIKQAKRFKSY